MVKGRSGESRDKEAGQLRGTERGQTEEEEDEGERTEGKTEKDPRSDRIGLAGGGEANERVITVTQPSQ